METEIVMKKLTLAAFCIPILLITAILYPGRTVAQGTLEDYQRADALRAMVSGLLVDSIADLDWIGESDRFWYRKTGREGKEFILVDADRRRSEPAFDHERLAEKLGRAAGEEYEPGELPFNSIEFIDEGRELRFAVEGWWWTCELESYECRKGEEVRRRGRGGSGPASDEPRVFVSPDSTREAFVRDHNVWVRELSEGEEAQLSFDGSDGEYYSESISWSPDSRMFVATLTRPGFERIIHYVESSPDDQVQPDHVTRVYTKPGDALTVRNPRLFRIDTGEVAELDDTLFANQYSLGRIVWREDSRGFTFEFNQRGHQVYRVLEADAATGSVRALIEEKSASFIDYSGKRYRYDLDDGREIIWASERDGWNHLYLYDGVTGEVKNRITQGEWVVRGVVDVDEESREIILQGSGREPGDPYLIHYYRIGFDGSGLTMLTEGEGNHSAEFSDDGEYFVDTWSRVDSPPVSVLRRTSNGRVVMELEESDITDLLATGWKIPEVFTTKGRDGTTDIWGIICRPTGFDASKSYRVIEYIYAGPHSSHVPKTFRSYHSMQALAELGFIVVQVDGMGTNNRGKTFHDVCWQDLGDAGFPDRILWHRAIADRYPWYDIDDGVGIYGTSAGGQNSTGAVLFHPDFYTVAVSSCGCHDNRMDKIWWNEQWMGWPIGPHYEASSNVVNAHRLEGRLFLIVGEMDTNVDPASTMQVVDALIEAGKDFDLLVLPGGGHTSGGEYGERRRRDFFVKHLLGIEPPDWNVRSDNG